MRCTIAPFDHCLRLTDLGRRKRRTMTKTMIPALESGRIDAIELAEPLLDEAEAAGQCSLSSGYEAVANEFAIGAYFCTTAFATAHPDVVRKFANVMAQTARWANTHQAESGEILAKWSKEAVPATMLRVIYGERATPALFQPVNDVSAKYKVLRPSRHPSSSHPAYNDDF